MMDDNVSSPNGIPRYADCAAVVAPVPRELDYTGRPECVANYVAILAILEPNRSYPGLSRDTVNCQQIDPSRASCPAPPSVPRRANSCLFPPTRP